MFIAETVKKHHSIPYIDEINWLKITEWKEINLEPIQLLNEFQPVIILLPYSFTIDTSMQFIRGNRSNIR